MQLLHTTWLSLPGSNLIRICVIPIIMQQAFTLLSSASLLAVLPPTVYDIKSIAVFSCQTEKACSLGPCELALLGAQSHWRPCCQSSWRNLRVAEPLQASVQPSQSTARNTPWKRCRRLLVPLVPPTIIYTGAGILSPAQPAPWHCHRSLEQAVTFYRVSGLPDYSFTTPNFSLPPMSN